MVLLGKCCNQLAPYPPVEHVLAQLHPEAPRERWRVPTPETVIDPLAPDGYWNVFSPQKAYRFELRSGFLPNPSVQWFVHSCHVVLQTSAAPFHEAGPWKWTPPATNFPVPKPDQLIYYPIEEADPLNNSPQFYFAPDPGLTLVDGYSQNRSANAILEPVTFPPDRAWLSTADRYEVCFHRSELSAGIIGGQEYFMTPSLILWLYGDPCWDDLRSYLLATFDWDNRFGSGTVIVEVGNEGAQDLAEVGCSMLITVAEDPNFNP